MPDLLQAVSTEMPEFSGKKDLLVHIGHCIPDFVLETVLGSADVTRKSTELLVAVSGRLLILYVASIMCSRSY